MSSHSIGAARHSDRHDREQTLSAYRACSVYSPVMQYREAVRLIEAAITPTMLFSLLDFSRRMLRPANSRGVGSD